MNGTEKQTKPYTSKVSKLFLFHNLKNKKGKSLNIESNSYLKKETASLT